MHRPCLLARNRWVLLWSIESAILSRLQPEASCSRGIAAAAEHARGLLRGQRSVCRSKGLTRYFQRHL